MRQGEPVPELTEDQHAGHRRHVNMSGPRLHRQCSVPTACEVIMPLIKHESFTWELRPTSQLLRKLSTTHPSDGTWNHSSLCFKTLPYFLPTVTWTFSFEVKVRKNVVRDRTPLLVGLCRTCIDDSLRDDRSELRHHVLVLVVDDFAIELLECFHL